MTHLRSRLLAPPPRPRASARRTLPSRPTLTDMLSETGLAVPPGLPPVLTGISADSREIRPGMLYAALPGSKLDGRAFIPDAVSRGAAAVLAPEGTVWPEGVKPVPLITDALPR